MDAGHDHQTVIRFGIMCNGLQFEAWQAKAIRSLLEHPQIECHLLLIDSDAAAGGWFRSNLRRMRFRNILWQVFIFLSKKWFKSRRRVDLSETLTPVPILECQTTKKGKYSQYFNDADVAAIRQHDLHFILRFGFEIIRGDILEAAQYGVWSFHHDDEQKYRGGPPCFWEIYTNDLVTASVLQRLTDKLDAGVILKKGFLKTQHSYTRNVDRMYFESARWPARVCVDILNGNTDILTAAPSTTTAPIFKAPTNLQFIRFSVLSDLKGLKDLWQRLTLVGHWNIGVANAPVHGFLDAGEPPSVTWFPNLPQDRFYADPFAFADGDKLHIFFEEYLYAEARGRIAYSCFEEGRFSTPQVVIEEPFHLSYPYLLEIDATIYMVPESFEANQVILYRAEEFPLRWKREGVLLEGYAGVDNTIFEHDGTWWMFSSDKYDGSSCNLNLFYADHPLGEWRPHPKNPVATDVRAGRSAGTPFVHEGLLYRPSMDYSEKVEGGITINRVSRMTKEDYREAGHAQIKPYAKSPFPDKIHALGGAGTATAVDGCKEVSIWMRPSLIRHQWRLAVRKLGVR